jgi:hypothetical protein
MPASHGYESYMNSLIHILGFAVAVAAVLALFSLS